MRETLLKVEELLQKSTLLTYVANQNILITDVVEKRIIDKVTEKSFPVIMIRRNGTNPATTSFAEGTNTINNVEINYFTYHRNERIVLFGDGKKEKGLFDLEEDIFNALMSDPTLSGASDGIDPSTVRFGEGIVDVKEDYVSGRQLSIGYKDLLLFDTQDY